MWENKNADLCLGEEKQQKKVTRHDKNKNENAFPGRKYKGTGVKPTTYKGRGKTCLDKEKRDRAHWVKFE